MDLIEFSIFPTGYFYAIMILAVTMFQTVLLSQYFERMFIVGMNLRTALISAIYRKSLKMTGKYRMRGPILRGFNLFFPLFVRKL